MPNESMQQAAVEHEALRHIIGALRTVLDWKPTAGDVSRKLSSLRFIIQSFQRHLERLMALKEQDGYMTEALQLALHYAFKSLRLHRLEANIQPSNAASIALVKRAGFVLEGYSERYLKVCGRWRDHERWAITAERWRAHGNHPRSTSKP